MRGCSPATPLHPDRCAYQNVAFKQLRLIRCLPSIKLSETFFLCCRYWWPSHQTQSECVFVRNYLQFGLITSSQMSSVRLSSWILKAMQIMWCRAKQPTQASPAPPSNFCNIITNTLIFNYAGCFEAGSQSAGLKMFLDCGASKHEPP